MHIGQSICQKKVPLILVCASNDNEFIPMPIR